MTKYIETTGRSEEDAIAAALFQLGLDRDDVSVEVLERAKTGFLGFGSNPAKVRVTYEVPDEGEKQERKSDPVVVSQVQREEKPSASREQRPSKPQSKPQPKPAAQGKPAPKPEAKPKPVQQPTARQQESIHTVQEESLTPAAADDPKAQRIREFLTGLMEQMEVEAIPAISVTPEGNYKVILQGKGLGAIIGRRGETLDAIQQLTNYAVNHSQTKRVRIHIDAEGYRAKREESLQRLARKMAGKVVRTRRSVTLEPMNAYERHVIHTALQDYPGVTTYSTGTEPNRRTVISYEPTKR